MVSTVIYISDMDSEELKTLSLKVNRNSGIVLFTIGVDFGFIESPHA